MTHWRINVKNKELSTDVDALTDTVELLFTEVATKGMKYVNLSGFKFDEVNPEHLAVVLRAMSSFKEHDYDWKEAFQVCVDACKLKNLDVNDVLYGLI